MKRNKRMLCNCGRALVHEKYLFTTKKRRRALNGSFLRVLLFFVVNIVCADQLYLRDDQVLDGKIARASTQGYIFINQTNGISQSIPREAVKFALYTDPKTATKNLDLEKWRKLCGTAGEAIPVEILPAKPFGQAILEAVKQAQTSIWITAYYISGSSTSPIKDFYDVLRIKAEAGLDVCVITEFGPRTSLQLRGATMNFAETLTTSGVHVRYLQESQVLHKKLIIIDGKTVFLGSSNLTWAGVGNSNEMNAKITDAVFAQEVVQNVAVLWKAAKEQDELKF